MKDYLPQWKVNLEGKLSARTVQYVLPSI